MTRRVVGLEALLGWSSPSRGVLPGEGVESEAQAALFSGRPNCQLQGFLSCRPLRVEQLRRFLASATDV